MSRKFEIVIDSKRKHLLNNIILPKRQTKNSAGYDFYLPEDVEIKAGGLSKPIFFDVKAKIGHDEVLLLYIRSSMAIKKGLSLRNGTGVIDSDYYSNQDNDGNIVAVFKNDSEEDVVVKQGERVMQGIITKFLITSDDQVENERKGGVGSTK